MKRLENYSAFSLQIISGKSPDDLQEDLKEGAAGAWLEKVVEEKATRIDRRLNFFVQTHKVWNQQRMLERARDMGLSIRTIESPGKYQEKIRD